MAGRFALQKLASGTSRSTSRLIRAQASASARPTTPVVHPASVARCLSTFPCSRAAAKAGWPTTVMPSTVVKKPAFLGSAGGMNRAFSSGASNKLEHSWEPKLTAWRTRGAAWVTNVLGDSDNPNCTRGMVLMTAFYAFCLLAPLPDR